VRLTLTTHSEGRLTDKDRAMAERIDAILGTSP
jgi:pterin-4a-carbinolamine dehydratase